MVFNQMRKIFLYGGEKQEKRRGIKKDNLLVYAHLQAADG